MPSKKVRVGKLSSIIWNEVKSPTDRGQDNRRKIIGLFEPPKRKNKDN